MYTLAFVFFLKKDDNVYLKLEICVACRDIVLLKNRF